MFLAPFVLRDSALAAYEINKDGVSLDDLEKGIWIPRTCTQQSTTSADQFGSRRVRAGCSSFIKCMVAAWLVESRTSGGL